MKAFLFLLFSLSIYPYHSYACMGAFDEVRTFMNTLPDAAETRNKAAFIEILSIKTNRKTNEAIFKVKVKEPIRGINEGTELTIRYQETSCTRPYDIKVGQTYYIAGDTNTKNEFYGSWRGFYQ